MLVVSQCFAPLMNFAFPWKDVLSDSGLWHLACWRASLGEVGVWSSLIQFLKQLMEYMECHGGSIQTTTRVAKTFESLRLKWSPQILLVTLEERRCDMLGKLKYRG